MEPPVTQYTRYTVTPRRRPTPLWVRVLKWTLMVIVVFTATTVGMAFGYLQRTVAQVGLNDPGTVTRVRQELTATKSTGDPVNILVLGSDRRKNLGAGDTGRSDTLLLLRIDPRTKSISMLSVPRDLRVDIPGYGTDRINAAYSVGGAPLAVKTFKAVTGLPVNHFIDVNFIGFVDIVDYLGGVYVDVDRRYFNNTAYTGYASIDLQAGYQRLTGRDALSFVRFRHDQLGDWGRIVRQQLFLRELKRQAFRWGNITKIPKLLRIISRNTVSDISSIKELLSLTQLVLSVDTSHIYQTHITGTAIVVGGADELQATPSEIAAVVDQFTHPTRPPVQATQVKSQPKRSFIVSTVNGGAPAGSAAAIAAQLAAQGYRTTVVGNAPPAGSTATVIYATPGYVGNAHDLAAMVPPATVVAIPRSPGVQPGVTIVAGPGFTGQLVLPQKQPTGPQIVYNAPQDAAQWHQLASSTAIKLRMPTAWVSGTAYDWTQSRTYTLPTGHGKAAAAVVVGTAPGGGFWHIEEMHWTDPPAITGPDGIKTVRGTRYMLFYNGAQLHMVAWKVGAMLYWVTNSLDNELSNDAMLALATSFKPVK
jgi:LCP family protein required for cell wall assembly